MRYVHAPHRPCPPVSTVHLAQSAPCVPAVCGCPAVPKGAAAVVGWFSSPGCFFTHGFASIAGGHRGSGERAQSREHHPSDPRPRGALVGLFRRSASLHQCPTGDAQAPGVSGDSRTTDYRALIRPDSPFTLPPQSANARLQRLGVSPASLLPGGGSLLPPTVGGFFAAGGGGPGAPGQYSTHPQIAAGGLGGGGGPPLMNTSAAVAGGRRGEEGQGMHPHHESCALMVDREPPSPLTGPGASGLPQ